MSSSCSSEENISEQLSNFPADSVNIIYADPPWKYQQNVKAGVLKRKNGELLYPSMTIKELTELGPAVERICKKDCALLLWATMPLLQESLDVIKAWGFKYKTCFVNWVKTTAAGDKPAFGVGYYTRSNAELCLLAVRGKIASYKRLLPDEADRGQNKMTQIVHEEGLTNDPDCRVNFLSLLDDSSTPVVMTPRRQHSRKPECIRNMIVRLFGDLPRVEFFARQQADGWMSLGNDTEHFKDESQQELSAAKHDRAHKKHKKK